MTAIGLWFFSGTVFSKDQNSRIHDLVDQLNGKRCSCEMRGGVCVQRNLFASFLRRNDKERCIIDAAQALGMMGSEARSAAPALIAALNSNHNVDSGDGILGVRSAIAIALGQIGDPSAIKPLIAILVSDDTVTLSSSASVPAGYKLSQGTSYGSIAEALGMFGPQAKEALPALNALMAKEQNDAYTRSRIEKAIKKISQE